MIRCSFLQKNCCEWGLEPLKFSKILGGSEPSSEHFQNIVTLVTYSATNWQQHVRQWLCSFLDTIIFSINPY